jgi:hypothetical protein
MELGNGLSDPNRGFSEALEHLPGGRILKLLDR